MNKEQKAIQKRTKAQIKEFCKQIQEDCLQNVDRAILSGGASEEFMNNADGNFLFAKAIVDSLMRDRPYRSASYKKEFDNLHKFL